ncbi:MAG: universal stress protein [Bacteroidota bacterium]
MKQILIPTDFSENAWNAISYAVQLFQYDSCTFHLLNTYAPIVVNSHATRDTSDEFRINDVVRTTSENRLQKTVTAIKSQFGNERHGFKIISSFNPLVDEIKNVVDAYGIELMVMGTKGASDMEDVFMGSNTVHIIKSIKKCPVLAIPRHFSFATPSEIAFATDFTRFYTTSELIPLLELAEAFNATIRIVHVQYQIKELTDLQKFNLNMLRKYFVSFEYYVHTVSELNSVSQTLEVFSQELDIHLLAMINHRHGPMEKMTHEPVVERTAFHTPIPLLVIPELGMEMKVKNKPKKVAPELIC